MTEFIIMTIVTVAFGFLLFYAIFKSVDNVADEPSDELIAKLFKDEKIALIFPEKSCENMLITENVLEKFKNTDGFYKLSEYYGLNLVRRVYSIENDAEHVANVFLYNNNIVAAFLTDTDLV